MYSAGPIHYINQVVYQLSIAVEFPFPAPVVFDCLIDLRRFPDWAQDVVYVSTTVRMHAGLTFSTETRMLGRVNQSEITVRELAPGRLIVLESETGLVSFLASYNIIEMGGSHCRVVCNARLTFSKAVFNLARLAIEAVAEARIRGDLEALRSLLYE